MLHPGSKLSAEEVAQNQRERLFAAMVATVAQKGFEATTVADLVQLSGVSRGTFYQHFANKEACFLACLEAILGRVREVITAKYDGRGGALRAFADLVAAQPAAAKVCFVEVYAAGPAANEMIGALATSIEGFYERSFTAVNPDRPSMPPELITAIVGGLFKVIHTRLCRGEAHAVPELVDQLRSWSRGYEPPPLSLHGRRHRKIATRRFRGYHEAERICRATATVVARKGYADATTAAIAESARVSLKTFYTHFRDKDDAVMATLGLAGAQMMAVVVPVARRAQDWRHGVRESCEALCMFLAAEPAFAKLAVDEVYVAGPRALERRDRIIDSLEALMAPGFKQHPEVPRIAAEAMAGAIYTLLREQLHSGGPGSLLRTVPFATYLTLEPFVGPYEAAVIANGERRPRKRLPHVAPGLLGSAPSERGVDAQGDARGEGGPA